jgi:leader peptidase (prepilin peptidase) / N-methyltransferase
MEPSAPARVIAAVVSGVVGASIGSFLNVVIYRVPRRLSIVRPRSHCPRCGTELGDAENVPVISWVVLRGRCRHCHEPISVRYPIVELATAALFVAFSLVLRSFAPVAPLDCLAAAALAGAAIALDQLPVPRSIVLAAAIGAASLAAVSIAERTDHRLAWAAIGGAAAVLGAAFGPWLVRHFSAGDGDRPGAVTLAVLLGSLAFAAGWLWPPGGLIAAGIATVACTLGARGQRAGWLWRSSACLVGIAPLVPAGPPGHA